MTLKLERLKVMGTVECVGSRKVRAGECVNRCTCSVVDWSIMHVLYLGWCVDASGLHLQVLARSWKRLSGFTYDRCWLTDYYVAVHLNFCIKWAVCLLAPEFLYDDEARLLTMVRSSTQQRVYFVDITCPYVVCCRNADTRSGCRNLKCFVHDYTEVGSVGGLTISFFL